MIRLYSCIENPVSHVGWVGVIGDPSEPDWLVSAHILERSAAVVE